MRAQDTPSGYGIVSIALHWLTAIIVLVIWFVGSSIRAGDDPESTLRLHTSIALTAYVLLWAQGRALSSDRAVAYALERPESA